MKPKLCEKCGKVMMQNPEWPGMWTCPDFQTAINDSAPFKFKCDGVYFSKKAVEQFEAAVQAVEAQEAQTNYLAE